MEDTRYCSSCGAPVNSAAKFCPSCGKQINNQANSGQERPESVSNPAGAAALQPVPSASQAVGAQVQETIHLILAGAARHSGFLGLKIESFVIVFTDLRVIFAHQTVPMMKENVKRAKEEAEKEGKGFFGKWGAQMGANSGKHYWQIRPQQILAEQPTNFAINREQLRSIRMRQEYSDENTPDTYQMVFDTVAGKHKFKFGNLNMRELKKQLQQLYGNIVR